MTGHLTQWLCLQPLHDIVLWSKKAQRIPEQKGGQCGWNTGGMGEVIRGVSGGGKGQAM